MSLDLHHLYCAMAWLARSFQRRSKAPHAVRAAVRERRARGTTFCTAQGSLHRDGGGFFDTTSIYFEARAARRLAGTATAKTTVLIFTDGRRLVLDSGAGRYAASCGREIPRT